jgi:hypothetical protein
MADHEYAEAGYKHLKFKHRGLQAFLDYRTKRAWKHVRSKRRWWLDLLHKRLDEMPEEYKPKKNLNLDK